MTEEIGYQTDGLVTWGDLVAETHEPNPDLQWPKSIDVFDRMRREDSQVGSVLRAVTLPIRRTEWMIDPSGARPEVVAHIASDLGLPIKGQTFVAPVRTRDRFSWAEHLRLALLHLPFGHSFFEQVYRFEETNLLHLSKLAWRPPRTISDVKVAADGGLIAIEQYGIGLAATGPRIPVDRLVAYVNEREGANWLGQSLLRGAYKNWLLKDRILRIQMLTTERNGLGVPVYTGAPAPDGMEPEEARTWHEEERKAGLKLTKQFRAGDGAGASLPNGAELNLVGVTGKLPDTDGPIRYHDEQIARAVLAHFLNLGTETGSWALGSTFANFFTDSLNAVAQEIASVAQQHIVEDLVDLNWGPTEPAPRIVAAPIGSEHPATAEAIKQLIESGAITVDADLEAYMRERYGLPVKAGRTESDDTDTSSDPGASLHAGDDADTTDAQLARNAAEVAQKVYLATDRKPLTIDEARGLIRRAGAELGDATPEPDPVVPDTTEETE